MKLSRVFAYVLGLLLALPNLSSAQLPAPPAGRSAPTPAQIEQMNQMMALMEKAMGPITQKDVNKFLKIARKYESWVSKNIEQAKQLALLPEAERQKKIEQSLKKSGIVFSEMIVLTAKLRLASQGADQKNRKKAKEDLVKAKQRQKEMAPMLAKAPAEIQTQMKTQMERGMRMLAFLANYPASSIKVYKKNKKAIDGAIQQLEALSKRAR
ncbi:MAG: hypothetical protein VYC39_15955 [Myxococcota bacterium]|nr:hypothetical protein [Myxococcota bacterium]